MKNKQYFLTRNFEISSMNEVYSFLLQEGWFFKTKKVAGKVRVYMYELEEDYDFWNDLACTAIGKTFEEALYNCVIELKQKYAAQN